MVHWEDIGDAVVSRNRVEWTIKDFFSHSFKPNEIAKSKIFLLNGKHCRLCICPKGCTAINMEGWFGCFLRHYTFEFSQEIYVQDSWLEWPDCTADFSIRKRNGKCTERTFTTEEYLASTRFIRWDTLEEYNKELVPNGHLTIVCHLRKNRVEPVKKESLSSKYYDSKFSFLYCIFKVW